MRHRLALVAIATFIAPRTLAADSVWKIDSLAEWHENTADRKGTVASGDFHVGDGFDLMGNGASLLEKTDPDKPFWKVDEFRAEGSWTSK